MKKPTICVFILLLLSVPCFAGPIFSTLGPGNTYDTSTGWIVGKSSPFPEVVDSANQFSFGGSTSYYLDTIELAAALYSGINELDVWLMSDTAGLPSTIIIEAFNFFDAIGPYGLNNPLLVGNSVLRPILNPGTNYWLVASAPNADTNAIWNWSSPPIQGTFAYRLDSGSWNVLPNETLGAFRVSGTPIPAPGVFVLGGMGLGMVGWLRRHRTL